MENKYKIYLFAGTLLFSVLYLCLLLFFKVEESGYLYAVSRILIAGISFTLGANLIFLIPFDKNLNISSNAFKFLSQIAYLIIICLFLFYTKVFQMDLNKTGLMYNSAGAIITLPAIFLSNQIVSEKTAVIEFSVLMIFRVIFMIHAGLIFAFLFKQLYLLLAGKV